MKKFLLSILLATSVYSVAEKTPIQFISYSVQILPATTQDGVGFGWELGYSSVGSETSVNHELMLATEDTGFSHESFFVFENDFEFEPFLVPFVLDLPPFEDGNDNGIDDFYEVSLPVPSIETVGRHPNANNQPVPFTATWTREAGQGFGTVVVELPSLGLTFQHTFQLLSYSGEFSYQSTNNLREGSLLVTNVLEAEDIMAGPLTVRVVNPTTLSHTASTWTNKFSVTYTVVTNLYLGLSRTNFLSYWLMEDGYAATSELDYVDWMMVISSADSNGNGQLDLIESETPAGEPPRLEVARLANGSLEVTVQGTPGQTYVLEFTSAIGGTWQVSQTITLTTETQKVTVVGAGSRRFFRLRQS